LLSLDIQSLKGINWKNKKFLHYISFILMDFEGK